MTGSGPADAAPPSPATPYLAWPCHASPCRAIEGNISISTAASRLYNLLNHAGCDLDRNALHHREFDHGRICQIGTLHAVRFFVDDDFADSIDRISRLTEFGDELGVKRHCRVNRDDIVRRARYPLDHPAIGLLEPLPQRPPGLRLPIS